MKVHPDDLDALLAQTKHPEGASLKTGGWAAAVLKVCEGLQSGLVISDETARRDWLTVTAKLSYFVRTWENRASDPQFESLPPKELWRLGEIAKKFWRAPSSDPVRPLPFVKDPDYRRLAERDLASLRIARRIEETKAAIALGGSVIEALLLDVIEDRKLAAIAAASVVKKLRSGKDPRSWSSCDPNDPDKWTFKQMIGVCGPDGLKVLGPRVEAIAETARDWRNMIHPRKERIDTKGDPLKPSDAALLEALVDAVLDALQP